ncbi:hypothetical protein PAMP_022838 [Pampus punctatissimus]
MTLYFDVMVKQQQATIATSLVAPRNGQAFTLRHLPSERPSAVRPEEHKLGSDEGGAGLTVTKICFISKTSHHANNCLNPHGSGFNRDDNAPVTPTRETGCR